MSKDQYCGGQGLLTANDLDRLGNSFTRLWPVEDTPCFRSCWKRSTTPTGISDAKGMR